MIYSQRAKSVAEIAQRVLQGEDARYEVKDFLHEFHEGGGPELFAAAPVLLEGKVPNGRLYDAYFQALSVYLCAIKLNVDPPAWTRPAIQLPDPWFASSGLALRNYLLWSSPAPFRARNIFIDEDSLQVA
jgi:hypothetical protein